MLVAGKVYQEFGFLGGQSGKMTTEFFLSLLLKMLAKSL